jgi:hypothetical protein
VRGSSTLTFDAEGNLWTIGGTTVDPTLSRYAADSVGTAEGSGDIEIDISPDVGCFPRWNALALDPSAVRTP